MTCHYYAIRHGKSSNRKTTRFEMKKKTLLILLSILIVLTGLVFLLPIRYPTSRQVRVALPINEVSPEFTQFRNWVKWFPGLQSASGTDIALSGSDSILNAPGLYLQMVNSGPDYINLKEHEGTQSRYHSIRLFADSFGFATNVKWTEYELLPGWLASHLLQRSSVDRNIFALKAFADDPSRFFGFKIKIMPVQDTLVMTMNTISHKKDALKSLAGLYEEMHDFLEKNHTHADDSRYPLGGFQRHGNDSMVVMAGLPVRQKIVSGNNIKYLEMPAGGKMLVGEYEGRYSRIRELYKAMDRYKLIRNLVPVASPFERYIISPLNGADSLHVKIELFYPIL